MAVFRVERNKGYTVMSNHHLRNKELSLKAKGLLSQMLSLPEDWDYTLKGLSLINREKIDAIREAIKELERAGYIVRSRERDEKGRLRGADYVIFEQPQPPTPDLPTLENPTLTKRLSQRRRQAPTGRTRPFCGSAARPGRTVSGSATFSSKTPRPTTHGVSTWSRQATASLPMQSS